MSAVMISIVVVPAAGFLILVTMNFLFQRTNYYKNSIREYEKFMKGVPKNLKFVNLGTTFARYGFQWGTDGFNFAVAPQTLHYDYKILRHYKKHIREAAVVCITLEPFIFCIADYDEEYTNIKYYSFLHPKEINNFTFIKYIRRKIFPVLLTKDAWKYVIHDIKKQKEYETASVESRKETISLAEKNIKNWYQQFGLVYGEEEPVPLKIKENFEKTCSILNNIIQLCKIQGWKPVIVIMPAAKEEVNLFHKNFLKTYLFDNVNQVCGKDVPVLNYFGDLRLNDYHYYRNADCLNEEGSRYFQKIVEEDLRRLFMERW